MTDLGRVLAVIPARGGSKRLPRKNILPLAGKPMMIWTLEAALQVAEINRVVVTSDDEEILSKVNEHAPDVIGLLRDPDLASDTASSVDVVLDAISSEERCGYQPDTVVLLQPTSPLRNAEDIRNGLALYSRGKDQAVVSVCELDHPLAWTGKISEYGEWKGVIPETNLRSQDYEQEYRLNGAIYIENVKKFKIQRSFFSASTLASIMPKDRGFDVDDINDLKLCDCFLSRSFAL